MKKIRKIFFLLLFFIISILFAKKIVGYFKIITNLAINEFSIQQKSGYIVRHETMNLDGITYSVYQEKSYNDIQIGTVITPPVLEIQGFTSPPTQTITIDSTERPIVTYRYTRNQYTLTINNSNYVTTSTPSGTYYYGTEIHLVADNTNIDGNSFVKWTDETYNNDYTFILTNNTTIGPIYAEPYIVTFEPNNGNSQTTKLVIKGESIGTIPDIRYDDCVGTTGDYLTRQCTYFYQFEGWYKEPTFENEVNEAFVPTEDITLYAKWSKIFYAYYGQKEFDGTNYIDTGIKLINQENAEKDFIITFTVDTNNGYSTANGGDRGTIFTDMNEKSDPYPGIHFFTQGSNKYTMNINVSGHKVKDSNTGYTTGEKIIIKKENGIVYYSYDNGPFIQINDFSSFTDYYDRAATFGAGINANGVAYRFFKGTLSDMSVELIDLPSYKIHFDANGGTGMMIDQQIKVGQTIALKDNSFEYEEKVFNGWNTQPDGTGISYSNKQLVTDIGSTGDIITLYAQWKDNFHYYIHFDANSGTGTMENQEFTYNAAAKKLSKNTFSKDEYIFTGWNTNADGSGNYYNDEEKVRNLTDVENETITLYAQYLKIKYNNSGDTIFDGTSNTFIDSGINLYSQENIDKDFEIRLTVKSVSSGNSTLSTIINCKDESNELWPGFNIRMSNSTTIVTLYKWKGTSGTSDVLATIASSKAPIDFIIRRRDGVVEVSYSFEGHDSSFQKIYDQADWSLNQYFADNVSFGGIYNNLHMPDRFFKGILSDIIISIDE